MRLVYISLEKQCTYYVLAIICNYCVLTSANKLIVVTRRIEIHREVMWFLIIAKIIL